MGKITNKYHLELLKELKKHKGQGTKHQQDRDKNYIGTKKFCYNIKTSIKRQIVKNWIKKRPKLSVLELTKLLDSLFNGKSHDEISLGGKLLESLPQLRNKLSPILLDKWLNKLEGWAEVDSICQSNFTAEEILSDWNTWERVIVSLSKSNNPHKKRASLVLLTRPVKESRNPKLSKLAFKIIESLKKENNILVTKAISWLLRDLIKNHKGEIEKYLKENENSLPRIAVREASNKLRTGRKVKH